MTAYHGRKVTCCTRLIRANVYVCIFEEHQNIANYLCQSSQMFDARPHSRMTNKVNVQSCSVIYLQVESCLQTTPREVTG